MLRKFKKISKVNKQILGLKKYNLKDIPNLS